jgi:SAM-dependent methyltransferase
MKDIVDNRKRISFARKVRVARLALRENGVLWCASFITYYLSSGLAHHAFSRMDRLRRTRNIPGLNSPTLNKEIWDAWNWSAAGDEWNISPGWKESLTHCVIKPFIPANGEILEIGPGAGRWTESLLKGARRYVGVDISRSCVAHCQQRFAADPRAEFMVGSGSDLTGVADRSIDAIWSFDVFVHINRAEIERYIDEFIRVLKPGGVAAIHHGGVGGASGGWRSNLTARAFEQMLRQRELDIDRSFAHWLEGETIHRLPYDDLITVFSKRASATAPAA